MSYRKIKDLMATINRTKYRMNIKKYNRSIILIEQILKYKINFELQQGD